MICNWPIPSGLWINTVLEASELFLITFQNISQLLQVNYQSDATYILWFISSKPLVICKRYYVLFSSKYVIYCGICALFTNFWQICGCFQFHAILGGMVVHTHCSLYRYVLLHDSHTFQTKISCSATCRLCASQK